MQNITRIDCKKRYSEAVIYNNTVYLSGQVPWESSNSTDDFLTQASEVFSLVDTQLMKAGTNKTKIISMTIYLKDPNDYENMNIIFDNWIPDNCAPARATIGNVIFPNNKWKLEIVVTAAI
jgi:enamine deaminase RidA (YjgF/YER057c/UK114 family)